MDLFNYLSTYNQHTQTKAICSIIGYMALGIIEVASSKIITTKMHQASTIKTKLRRAFEVINQPIESNQRIAKVVEIVKLKIQIEDALNTIDNIKLLISVLNTAEVCLAGSSAFEILSDMVDKKFISPDNVFLLLFSTFCSCTSAFSVKDFYSELGTQDSYNLDIAGEGIMDRGSLFDTAQ